MEIVSQEKIDDLIENGYALQPSEYISGGVRMVKENLGLFVGYTVLMFVINAFASIFPFGGLVVGAPLTAGFFLAANKLNQGYELELGDFFKGFNHLGQLVVYSLLVILLFAILAIPAGVFAVSMIAFDFDGDFAIIFALMFGFAVLAMVLYFAVSFMWAPHLIIFGKKKAWESMEISHKIIKKDFINFIGFGLMLGLMNIAGFLFFGVGLLFTIPATACALYLAFEDVTEMRLENNDGLYLDKHLVD